MYCIFLLKIWRTLCRRTYKSIVVKFLWQLMFHMPYLILPLTPERSRVQNLWVRLTYHFLLILKAKSGWMKIHWELSGISRPKSRFTGHFSQYREPKNTGFQAKPGLGSHSGSRYYQVLMNSMRRRKSVILHLFTQLQSQWNMWVIVEQI